VSKNVQILTDENFFSTIEKGISLVDFHAVWCAPCRMLSPIIEEVAEHFVNKVFFGKIDIDSEEKTASQFQITSVPTLILFKDGKEINRLNGLCDADTLKDFLQESLV
jgi:thioredoxin 1